MALKFRKACRKGRRSRNLRYRKARFLNRGIPKGWHPPSLMHRVNGIVNLVKRFCKIAPVTIIDDELVGFDLQKLENPNITREEYNRGTRDGMEVRQYVLARGGYRCAYCGATGVPLNLDHVIPKSKGGSDRVSNLVPACVPCNQKKGAKTLEEFLYDRPELAAAIRAQGKRPLRDASAVNTIRWKLLEELRATGLPVHVGTGAETKFNREQFNVPKEHWLDALCVGKMNSIHGWENLNVLTIKSVGRGRYKRTSTDKYGFPRAIAANQKRYHGVASGDMVRAVVTEGKRKGVYVGKACVRKSGYFGIKYVIDGLPWRYFQVLSRADGYAYEWGKP